MGSNDDSGALSSKISKCNKGVNRRNLPLLGWMFEEAEFHFHRSSGTFGTAYVVIFTPN